MLVVPGLAGLSSEAGRLFIVVGVFDGIHRGHSYLLGQLRRQAHRRGAHPAVITFDAHPDEVLVGSAPPLICDPEERLVRLAAAGIELTVIEHFDRALRMTPYDAFVRMITERAQFDGLLMTPDAAFGHERRGTPEALAELGVSEGFHVVVVPPFVLEGRPVSSSAIRSAVAGGELHVAARLLGRPYAIVGTVRQGRGGAHLDFPLPVALPPAGAYPVEIQPFALENPPAALGRTAVIGPGIFEIEGWDGAGLLRVQFGAESSSS